MTITKTFALFVLSCALAFLVGVLAQKSCPKVQRWTSDARACPTCPCCECEGCCPDCCPDNFPDDGWDKPRGPVAGKPSAKKSTPKLKSSKLKEKSKKE